MKRQFFSLAVVLILIVVFGAATAGAQQTAPAELLLDLDPSEIPTKSVPTKLLKAIESEPTTAEVRLVALADHALLERGAAVELGLFRSERFSVRAARVERRAADDWTYFGEIVGVEGQAIMVIQDGQVTASIWAGKNLYRILPIEGRIHAVVRVDSDAFPLDDEMPAASLSDGRFQLPKPKPASAPRAPATKTTTNIKVLVAYTPSAAAQYSNINALIQLAVDETNVAYSQSGVNQQLELAHTVQVSYSESFSGQHLTDLTRFQGTSDGHMDNIHGLRDQHHADIAVLVVNDGSVCGRASAIGATATTAFATVHHSCATGNYSFGHEIAHLQGCRHDNDPGTTPYAYAHGYFYSPGGWRTIMGVVRTGVVRIQRFSNPDVYWYGVATGTAATNDCARGHDTSAPTVANFRTEPQLSVSISGPSWLEWGQSGTWTAVVSNASGSVSYKWFVREESSSTYVQVGTGSSYSRTGYESFDLKLEVTDSDETRTAFRYVFVSCPQGEFECPV